jgi:hypothetical protein
MLEFELGERAALRCRCRAWWPVFTPPASPGSSWAPGSAALTSPGAYRIRTSPGPVRTLITEVSIPG